MRYNAVLGIDPVMVPALSPNKPFWVLVHFVPHLIHHLHRIRSGGVRRFPARCQHFALKIIASSSRVRPLLLARRRSTRRQHFIIAGSVSPHKTILLIC